MIPIVRHLIGRNPGTISLAQGVVHYPPPPEVREGVAAFFREGAGGSGAGANAYGPVGGIDPLVERIAQKLRSENGIDVGGGDCRAVVTAGGNMAFLNAALAVCDVGDEVILLSPYYFNHEMAVTMASARPVVVATDENYQPRVDAIAAAITPQTRGVVTISPNNPTGAVYPQRVLREINALCANRGIYHVHDEAYEYFTFGDARHFSPGSIPGASEHTISLFSLSKSYGFASWRIGYMTIPAKLLPAVHKIQDTNLICPPVVSQYAAIGALRAGAGYCRERVGDLSNVRRLVLDHLAELADIVTVPRAEGAMYFLVKVRTERHDMELVEALVRDFRVAVMPGSTFGIHDGCCLRVSYGAVEKPTVADGITRLVRGLRKLV